MLFFAFKKNTFLAYTTGLFVIVFLVLSSLALSAQAAVNPKINYQGKLTTAAGVAVANGTYNMRFWLLTTPSIATTSAVWTESLTAANKVQVTNGLFSVMLGSSTPLTSVNFNQTLYLGVEIGGTGSPAWDGEMSPRKVIGTVPAAFEARRLEGLASTSFVRTDKASTIASSTTSSLLTITQNGTGNILDLFDGATKVFTVLDGGNIGIGTSTPAYKLTVAGNARITGALYDSTNSAGTLGQILKSTATGQQWVATSTLGLSSAFTTSAQLAAILSDETGTAGNVVFSASPTFTGTVNGAAATLSSTLTLSGSAANIALGSNYLSGDGGDEGVFVDSVGRVGIGTSTPTAKLTIQAVNGETNQTLFRIASSTSATTTNLVTIDNKGSAVFAGPVYSKGVTWTARSASEVSGWLSVTYGNGIFVAVANSGTNRVMTSPDGIVWTSRTVPEATNQWISVTYGNGVFVAVAASGTNRVMTSPDGITWTARAASEANSWNSVTYGNGLFVAVSLGGTNRVMTSPDGVTWTPRSASEANTWTSVTYANGLFVAVSLDGTNQVMTSPDGITWSPQAEAAANQWYAITYGNGMFVAASYNGTNRIMTSSNGTSWVSRTATEASGWAAITYGNGMFVATALSGTNRVMTSFDGITWTPRKSTESNQWYSVVYANGIFIAVANSGTNRVMTSGQPETSLLAHNNIYQGGLSIMGGNTGIGTTTATSKLSIIGQAGSTQDIFSVSSSTATKFLTVKSTGNIGIGTSTPAYKLTVAGNARITGALYDSTNSAGTLGQILKSTATGQQWVATSTLGLIGSSSLNTSAKLAALLSDETGTGALVFATSPTLVTPNLGTPSTLVGTNITGTASGLTAGTVTTNANLTGMITSVGNAASLGSFTSANLSTALTDETGSGVAVFATAPTLASTTITGRTKLTNASTTNLTISGKLYDNTGSAGTNGYFLKSTGTGFTWVATSTLNVNVANIGGLGTGVATFLGTPTTANLASAVTGETGSGSLVFGTAPTLSSTTISGILKLSSQTASRGLFTDAQSRATTTALSATLLNSLTDETGTGVAVFATSPTLVTPNLGTPSTLVGTNITGTASGLTAGTVTTNANLTGAVTSTGNATVLGSFSSANLSGALTDETGSGVAVFATAPTLASTTITGRTKLTNASTTNLTISGKLFDGTNSAGTTGQILRSTGTGFAWTSTSTLGLIGSSSLNTSAKLAALITNETGSGSLVFGTAPTLSSTTISGILKLSSQTASRALFTDAQSRATTTALSATLLNSLTDETGTGVAVFGTAPTLASTTITGRTKLTNATTTSLTILGKFFDNSSSAGTNGMVLKSTGTGFTWVATSTLGLTGLTSASIDTSSELAAILTDETGSGRSVFSGSPAFFGTATFAALTATGTLTVANNINISDTTNKGYQIGGNRILYASSTNSSILVGIGAGFSLKSSASANTAIGTDALATATSSSFNTAVGYQSLYFNTVGSSNTAQGYRSLYSNSSGVENTAQGNNALRSNTTGVRNTGIGFETLRSNTAGSYNTALGYFAGYEINAVTAVGSNTLIGYNTGRGITTGVSNTVLGANVTGLAAALSNNIIIADGDGNQRINVGSTGNVGLGTTTPNQALSIFRAGADAAISFGTVSGANEKWTIGIDDSDGAKFKISSSSSLGTNDRLVINGAGYVGIGTSVPGTNLHVKSGDSLQSPTSVEGLFVESSGSSNSFYVLQTASVGGGKSFSVTNAGNVGIGTTTPSRMLTVAGTARITGALYDNANSAGTNGMVLKSTGTGFTWVATSTLGISASGGLTAADIDTSSELATILTNETGSGALVFGTSPTLSSTTISGILKLSSQTASRGLFTDAQSRATTTALSATLLNSLTDETGTGVAVFGTAPTFTTSITSPSLLATANDSGALGASGTAFSDLFLASGGVINWLAGDVTLTHTADLLTMAGGDLRIQDATNSYGGLIKSSNTAGLEIASLYGGSDIIFSESTLERMRLKDGKLGIGTSTPESKLHVYTSGVGTAISGANDIVIENNSNSGLSILSNSASTGNIYFGDSAAAGAGTIIYSHVSDSLAFGANNGERMRITSAGYVGIGTTTPSRKLEIYQGSIQLDNNQYLYSRLNTGTRVQVIGYDGSNQTLIGANSEIALGGSVFLQPASTGDIYATLDSDTDFNAGSGKLFVNGNTGNVGIGTTTPTQKLHLNGGRLLVTGSSYVTNPNGAVFGQYDATTGYAQAPAGGKFQIWNDDTTAVATFADGGNVGIGTSTPAQKFVVSGTVSLLGGANGSVLNPTAGYLNIRTGSSALRIDNNAGALNLMTVLDGGNVGIGTTTPSTRLTVVGASNFTSTLSLSGSAANIALGSNYLSGDGGDEGIYVDSTGNVGIGTSSPLSQFHVEGSSAGLRLARTGGSEPFIYLYDGSVANLYGGQIRGLVTDRGLRFTDAAASTEWMRINGASGNIGVGTTTPALKFVIASSTDTLSFDANLTGTPRIVMRDNASTTRWVTDNLSGDYRMYTSSAYDGSAGTIRMFIDGGNGNVGIGGTQTPTSKLTVGGNIELTAAPVRAASAWASSHAGGQEMIYDMVEYNGKLYATQGDGSGDGDVIVFDGSSWTTAYDGVDEYVLTLAVFNGKLYAGNAGVNAGDGDVLVCNPATAGVATDCDNASDWTVSYAGSQEEIRALAVYNGKLYAGQSGNVGDADIYVFDGSSWTLSYNGAAPNLYSMVAYNGKLYAGQGQTTAGSGLGDIYSFNGTTWAIAYNGAQEDIRDLAVYNGKLYAAQGAGTGDGDVLVLTDSAGTLTASISYNGAQEYASALEVYDGKLYAGFGSGTGDGDVLVLNSPDGAWTTSYNGSQEYIKSFGVYNNKLYAGEGNGTGDGDIYVLTSAATSSYSMTFTAGSSAGSFWFANEDVMGVSGLGTDQYGVFKMSHSLVTNAGAYDVAEDYPTADQNLDSGDILAYDTDRPGYLKKATKDDRALLAGVVSTQPGFLLASKDRKNMVPTALVGRVPVKVTNEHGAIAVGDSVSISEIEDGFGAKANFGERAIGYALEPLEEDTATSTVLVYVSIHTAFGMNPDPQLLASSTDQTVQDADVPTGSTLLQRLTQLATSFIDGVLHVAGLKTDELCIGNTCVNEAQLIQVLDAIESGQNNPPQDGGGGDTGDTGGGDSGSGDTGGGDPGSGDTGGIDGGGDTGGGNQGDTGTTTPPPENPPPESPPSPPEDTPTESPPPPPEEPSPTP